MVEDGVVGHPPQAMTSPALYQERLSPNAKHRNPSG